MSTQLKIALTLASVLVVAGICKAQTPRVYNLSGDVAWTHDPSIAKDGKTWYVFATGRTRQGGQFAVRCSDDLEHWKLCGQVFNAIPAWITKRSPGTKDLWAPDVSYENHEYRLYYAYSLFGKNTSGIALAVNKTLDPTSPDYNWVDKGLVLESTAADNFNAIDPNFVRDHHGNDWLAFGSFWDGIKMRRLDDATGLLSSKDTKLYSLARRVKPADAAPARPGLPPDWEAIEAPFIVFHGGYYYLFTSWDLCCRGIKSTYKTMVGRSKSVTGPYVDASGKPLLEGGGTPLLIGNSRWLGPGGESLYMGPKGNDLIVFHAYDAKTGRPSMQLSTIAWTNGWPHATLEQ
ncbi:MAG: arabinan endo-1,5-alpha-L-arabinosidase [Acidobacteriaceae bacterium]